MFLRRRRKASRSNGLYQAVCVYRRDAAGVGLARVQWSALLDFARADGTWEGNGGEVAVLQGMREVLQRHRPVLLCEMHGRNKEVAETLSEVGYLTQVIEEDNSLEMARWNAHVVAWYSSDPPPPIKNAALFPS